MHFICLIKLARCLVINSCSHRWSTSIWFSFESHTIYHDGSLPLSLVKVIWISNQYLGTIIMVRANKQTLACNIVLVSVSFLSFCQLLSVFGMIFMSIQITECVNNVPGFLVAFKWKTSWRNTGKRSKMMKRDGKICPLSFLELLLQPFSTTVLIIISFSRKQWHPRVIISEYPRAIWRRVGM